MASFNVSILFKTPPEYEAKEVQQEQATVQNPEVKSEPIPFGTKPPSNINGAHSL